MTKHLLTGCLLTGGLWLLLPGGAVATPAPVSGRSAPAFSLQDAGGKAHPLSGFRHAPVALFFFCGCDPCRRCASLWAQARQAETSSNHPLMAPSTLIVFSGDAASARDFLTETGLDPKTTTLLFDPREQVADSYGVTVCPRVFLLDGAGQVRYTNDERGMDPQTTPAVVVVSRTLAALRSFPVRASASAKMPPKMPPSNRYRRNTSRTSRRRTGTRHAP